MRLRPAQARILEYRGGKLAIDAVPGSGKTFTLAHLTASLIQNDQISIEAGQRVLVVTYLNASVAAFRTSIKERLSERQLDETGFEVRTLHSLAMEILQYVETGTSDWSDIFSIADDVMTATIMDQAIEGWLQANRQFREQVDYQNNFLFRVRWRELIEKMAAEFIRSAKNLQFEPSEIFQHLARTGAVRRNPSVTTRHGDDGYRPTPTTLAEVYDRYEGIRKRMKLLDFDDIIWKAIDRLEESQDALDFFRHQWPFVLEDEAQDSIPLQEKLLSLIAGRDGNWVRAGDPNQAITSTFTSANPRHFIKFISEPDVTRMPLPNSGRSAPKIYRLANELVDWVCNYHPVPEVRNHAFLNQRIQPSPPGDSQANPVDSNAKIEISVFKYRVEGELPAVALRAANLIKNDPNLTAAILVPTNRIGKKIAINLDKLNAPYDDRLKGGGRARQVAAILHSFLSVLINPQKKSNLLAAYTSLLEIDHPIVEGNYDTNKVTTLLRSINSPENFLFPKNDDEWRDSLPIGVASKSQLSLLVDFSGFLRSTFRLRELPTEDLLLSLADLLFTLENGANGKENDVELALAYQLSSYIRSRHRQVDNLPISELAAQLMDLARGRTKLDGVSAGEHLRSTTKGRITLATQHGAKGLEFDAVFLTGIDSYWIPADLSSNFYGESELFGGDPAAGARSMLFDLMELETERFPGRTATESARIELICERLRLLYVGITRARSFLHISRSRYIKRRTQDIAVQSASVMAPLFNFVRRYDT